MTAFSRTSPSPDSLDRAMQHELTALAALETNHRSACRWLEEWSGPKAVKEHVAFRLEERHRTEREAYVLRLADLHQQVVCEKGCLGAQAGVGAARHALCRTTRAAQRRAHKALSQATRSRRLWPAAARMALIASPCAPNRRLRSTRPSLFRCPITGSMALRRRSSRRIVGETMPRVCETKTWVGPSSL